MRALVRRLRRLEKLLAPAVESEHSRRLRARIEDGRVRLGPPPSDPEPRAEFAGMSVIEMLHAGRDRARLATDDS